MSYSLWSYASNNKSNWRNKDRESLTIPCYLNYKNMSLYFFFFSAINFRGRKFTQVALHITFRQFIQLIRQLLNKLSKIQVPKSLYIYTIGFKIICEKKSECALCNAKYWTCPIVPVTLKYCITHTDYRRIK